MSLPPFALRRATPDDAEDFARLMGDPAVQGQTLQMPWPDAAMWRVRLQPPERTSADLHLVAVADGRVIGSAGVHAAAPSPRRRHAMSLGIAVDAGWHGRGVGKALMQALCDYADRWAGVQRLELSVFVDNARAIALYRHFGFVEEGVHRAYAMRDGELADVLAMARLRLNG